MLIMLRIILGVSESPSFPAYTRAATDWLPMKERSRALALGLAAVPLSSVIGAPLSTALIYHFGWTEMFIFLGVVGIIWSIIWLILFRKEPLYSSLVKKAELDYVENHKTEDNKRNGQNKSSWRFILFNKTFLLNNYAFFAFGYLLFFGVTWLPGYISQMFNLNIKQVGIFLILPWVLSTIAILFCGWFSDKLWHKTQSLRISRSLIIGVSMVASALLFLPAIFIHDLAVDIVFISLAIASGLLSNSCFYALNADLSPDKAGTSLAIMDVFLALAGIIAPLATGYFSNLTGNFEIAIGIMMGLNLSSGLLVLIFQNPDKELVKKVTVIS